MPTPLRGRALYRAPIMRKGIERSAQRVAIRDVVDRQWVIRKFALNFEQPFAGRVALVPEGRILVGHALLWRDVDDLGLERPSGSRFGACSGVCTQGQLCRASSP